MTGPRPGQLVWVAAGAIVAACFSPVPPSGLPCTDAGACPGDLVCTGGLCQDPNGDRPDGRPGEIDATPDAVPIECVDASECPVEAPVCDPGSKTCRLCVADAECLSDACLEYAGTCADEAATLYVAPGGNGNGQCTRAMPCQRLCQAEGMTSATRNVIKIADGTYTSDACTFGTGPTLVIVSGADRAAAGATLLPGFGGILVRNGSDVLIEGIEIHNALGDGINQQTGTLELHRVLIATSVQAGVDMRDGTLRLIETEIVGNGANGLFLNNGAVEVSRSRFVDNDLGAMRTKDTLVTVVDSMIVGNGVGQGGTAVWLDHPAAGSRFAHNTVAGNQGNNNPAMQCGPNGAPGNLAITSSIFAGNIPDQFDDECVATHSLFTASSPPGTGNITGAPLFVDPFTGDYHITTGSAARNAADPASTEPVDFDGEPRPQGTGRDIGADEIPIAPSAFRDLATPGRGLAGGARLARPSGMRSTSILVATLMIAACGGGGDGGSDARDGDAPGDTMVGRIDVEESDLGGVVGTVASIYTAFEAPDGEPDLVNDGTCRVYEYPCLGSVGACAGVPGHSAGTIAITGLNAAVTLAPDPETHSYQSPSGLPDDLFADGATVTATAAGDEVGAFALSVTAVEPLISGYANAALGLVPGDPYDLTWTAGSSGAQIQFRVNWADICHAGAEWYVLICEFDDTGAFTVPASITTHLPAGFGQCGARVARFRRATVPGRDVELTVASSDFFGFF